MENNKKFMKQPTALHTREERATWISPWAPIAFALMAVMMLLVDIFAAYPIFQTVENIQSKQPLQVFCREGDRGQVLYLKQDEKERKLNEKQLCQTLLQYADYQVYDMVLVNYPLDYAPDVISMTFTQSAPYADLPAVTFQHYVDLDKFRHDAKILFFSALLWILSACLLVMLTMYLQKIKYK